MWGGVAGSGGVVAGVLGALWGVLCRLLRGLSVSVARHGVLVTRGRLTLWSNSLGAAAMH